LTVLNLFVEFLEEKKNNGSEVKRKLTSEVVCVRVSGVGGAFLFFFGISGAFKQPTQKNQNNTES